MAYTGHLINDNQGDPLVRSRIASLLRGVRAEARNVLVSRALIDTASEKSDLPDRLRLMLSAPVERPGVGRGG